MRRVGALLLVTLCGAALVGCARSPRTLIAAAPNDGAPAAQPKADVRRLCCAPPPGSQADLDCYCLRRARKTSNWITVGMSGAVILYGFAAFDYGSSRFRTRDDGWFQEDTDYGGADKVGHAAASAISTAVFASINRKLGIPRKEAALRGAITTFLVQALVEVGDGFSEEHGWTYGDMVANTAGIVFGYYQETSPRFDRLFDLRWEYAPTSTLFDEADDPLTDYDGSAYLLALNVGAVARPRRCSWLDVVDLQLGYQARNYVGQTAPTERTVFVGVGINFANLLRRLGLRGFIPSVFEYYQPPYTSLRIATDL